MSNFTCTACKQKRPNHEQYSVEGQLLCPNCAEWLTTHCSECHTRILKANNKGEIDEPLCTKDLIELVELFQTRGVHLVSLKESIDTGTSTGKLLFSLMATIAQFECDVIAERTREGLEAARAQGRVGDRPRVDSEKLRNRHRKTVDR